MKVNVIITTILAVHICFTLALAADQPEGNDRDPLQEAETVMRDPFWPVGYYPTTEDDQQQPIVERVTEQEDIYHEAAASQLRFSRVNRMGARYFAMINGSPYEVGDHVSLSYRGRIYQWEITSISDQSVRLQAVMENDRGAEDLMEIMISREEPYFGVSPEDYPVTGDNETEGE